MARTVGLARHPRDRLRTHRTRGAHDCDIQPTSRPGPTLARAAASDGGSHGRHPVRDDRGGSPRLRRPRGRWSTAGGRSLGGRAERNPIRLRQLLPDNAALPIPLSTPIVTAGTDADARPADNRTLWAQDAQHWNDTFGAALNSHRASARLPSVTDVRSHIFADKPWLAADPTLAPWPEPADLDVVQTGASVLMDQRRLSPELQSFLEAGVPPIYFGFGSMRAPQDLSKTMIQAARALGRRAIISSGWANLTLLDNQPDCMSIGEVNQQALFKRVAVVVHHGGAGTTTTAARAGVPQVVLPQMYDQHYFAQQIHHLKAQLEIPPLLYPRSKNIICQCLLSTRLVEIIVS